MPRWAVPGASRVGAGSGAELSGVTGDGRELGGGVVVEIGGSVVEIGGGVVVEIGGGVVGAGGVVALVATGTLAEVVDTGDVVVVVETFGGAGVGHTGSDVPAGGAGTVVAGSVAAIGTDMAPSSPAMAAETRNARESFLMITSSEIAIPGDPVECASPPTL
ncbi:hypothetical protein IU450_22255 [Nocardia abscessus]|uniref:hypothetical protein n=1 Tax=Nocardia abscessus TaxID=120957 RepID=UPI0018959226|nr:hypothetical protein [Nocardia abscessus]MBF6338595.1 hypothetical protein [Nocardia abscessus]